MPRKVLRARPLFRRVPKKLQEHPISTLSNERAGLAYALTGFALLSCGDAVIKSIHGGWPPTAVACTRYVLGMIGLCLLLAVREGRAGFRMPMPALQALRGFGVAMATVGFFSAVFVMPLATATSITFTSPMITAVLSALFLGETARRETWLATLFAFAGVLVVLRPNFATLGLASLLPLMSALGMSVLMIANRATAGKASPLAMQFFVALWASPLLILATLAGHVSGMARLHVSMPDWTILARCGVVAVSASLAHWSIFRGTERAGPATIAPMTYVQLLVASVLGVVLFGELPDHMTLLGAGMIVASGLWLWHAGRVREVAPTE